MKLLQFELKHGNEVLNTGAAAGYNLIELRLPFHKNDPAFESVLAETLHPWVWGSQHYEEEYEGFRSSIFPNDALVVRKH
jgi:hypothetical protein